MEVDTTYCSQHKEFSFKFIHQSYWVITACENCLSSTEARRIIWIPIKWRWTFYSWRNNFRDEQTWPASSSFYKWQTIAKAAFVSTKETKQLWRVDNDIKSFPKLTVFTCLPFETISNCIRIIKIFYRRIELQIIIIDLMIENHLGDNQKAMQAASCANYDRNIEVFKVFWISF